MYYRRRGRDFSEACLYGTVAEAGIEEMPKSEIERRKRNIESISRISRRDKRNVEIYYLVREENENFYQKELRNLQFSQISRIEREILKINLMIREEIEASRFQTFHDEKEKFIYHHSHSYFCFIFLLS